MRRSRSGRTAAPPSSRFFGALAGVALLTACQTTQAPIPAVKPSVAPRVGQALSDAPGEVVAQNKGWVVKAHPATKNGAAYCVATRTDASAAFPLSFRATAKGAAMVVKSDQLPDPDSDKSLLKAIFPDGEQVSLEARPAAGGGIVVPVALPTYEDLFEPFMRAKAVTFQAGPTGKPDTGKGLDSVNLGGSSWALSALDECRVLHTEE